MVKKPPIYFLHIPKTAGTSLRVFLDSQFRPNEIFPYQLWHKYLNSLNSRQLRSKVKPMRRYKLIRGHFGYGAYHDMALVPQVITMLREPVERSVSGAFHESTTIQRKKARGRYKGPVFYEGECENFEDSFKPVFRDRYHNIQAKYLAYDFNIRELVRGAKDKASYINRVRLGHPSLFASPALNEAELFNKAKQHLNESACFGIQDYFPESILLLCHKFGWAPKLSVSRHMVHNNRPKITALEASTIKKIENGNKVDKKLFEYAKIEFLKNYQNLIKAELGISPNLKKIVSNRQMYIDDLLANMGDSYLSED